MALHDGTAVNLAGGTHHAFGDHGEGFCIFNDSVVAARTMQADVHALAEGKAPPYATRSHRAREMSTRMDLAPPALVLPPAGQTVPEATAPTQVDAARPPPSRVASPRGPGLDSPPWPGDLGQRVFENVSAQAWKLWEERMKMILNEYRLMPWQKEAQDLVAKHMEDFFFGEGAALPPGYVPQQAK